jgi:hypothetical protein
MKLGVMSDIHGNATASNPSRADRRATYAVIDVEPDGHRIEHRLVDYDRAAVVRAIDEAMHPSASYLKSFHTPRTR